MIVRLRDLDGLDKLAFSPFGTPYLAVQLTDGDTARAEWLRALPCPVLGIGSIDHQAAWFCDVVTATSSGLAGILANIEAAPIAAMTLVQVLRKAENLPASEALHIESMAYATLQGAAENRAWLAKRPPPRETDQANGTTLVHRAGGILNITLNRPAAMNAINLPLRDDLAEAFALAATDESITGVHLFGAGRCFSIGGAMEDFGKSPDQAVAHAIRCSAGPAIRLAAIAARTTAHVHGACIGAGAELAALCGKVVARPNTFFQLPEIRYGLIPGSGGTAALSRRIGRQRAGYIMLSARRIGVRTALAWGLVDALDEDPAGQTLSSEHLPSETGPKA
jgi:enoyl-CoA hydratase/carnithine racemase